MQDRTLLAEIKTLSLDGEEFFSQDELQLYNTLGCTFQPIINIDRNKIYGYTAYLKPNFCDIKTLIEQLKADGQMHLLEKVSRYIAVEKYRNMELQCPLFIKSIPMENLSIVELALLENKFNYHTIDICIDVVEYDEMSGTKLRGKAVRYPMCISNFGQGIWKSGKTISLITPRFVKMGKLFTNDIYMDKTKQENFIQIKTFLDNSKTMIIATEVEKEEDYNYLRKIGVHFASGFYVDKLIEDNLIKEVDDDINWNILFKQNKEYAEDIVENGDIDYEEIRKEVNRKYLETLKKIEEEHEFKKRNLDSRQVLRENRNNPKGIRSFGSSRVNSRRY